MTRDRVQNFVHIIALPAFDYFTKYSNFGLGGKPRGEIELWCETISEYQGCTILGDTLESCSILSKVVTSTVKTTGMCWNCQNIFV